MALEKHPIAQRQIKVIVKNIVERHVIHFLLLEIFIRQNTNANKGPSQRKRKYREILFWRSTNHMAESFLNWLESSDSRKLMKKLLKFLIKEHPI